MKFRVKMTLAIIILLSLVFGIGGSLLISVSFTSTLENEKDAALRSYRAVQNTLLLANSISQQTQYDDIVNTLTQLDGQNSALWSGVYLSGPDGALYRSGILPSALLEDAEEGYCRISVFEDKDGRYIQVSGTIKVNENSLALHIVSDVTKIYDIRQTQISIYQRLFAVVVALGAAVSWLIAAMLTRPLMRLSRMSREIASGSLGSRARVSSGDEFELLADDFNAMAEKLQSNIDELRDAMRRQEEFMGSFAHELKTPMTSIIGYADLLRSHELSDDERQEAANYIFSEGRRLESLSLKLLDLLVLKKQDFELREESPSAIISGIVHTMKPALSKRGITIKYRCENGSCMLEPDLVKSLLINLIDNARKAMDSGGIIFLLSEMTDTGCRIQVVDNGRGIPKAELSRITEAFYRVDKSRSRAQGGVGLGLALCSEIVKLHKGDMQFKSAVGKGTSITVSLNGGRV